MQRIHAKERGGTEDRGAQAWNAGPLKRGGVHAHQSAGATRSVSSVRRSAAPEPPPGNRSSDGILIVAGLY